MKTSNFKTILFFAAVAALLCGCTKEDDFETQDFTPILFGEDFSANVVDNSTLDTPGWINFAEAGTVKWKEQVYSGNAYAEFTGYQSNQPSTIGWLVSPSINMDTQENEKLVFLSAQAYVDSYVNSLEAFISTDFDGTNVMAATWQPLEFVLPPLGFDNNFDFVKSGEIDLSGYTGNVNIAFRVKGGNANAIDGTYQIDNIRIIY